MTRQEAHDWVRKAGGEPDCRVSRLTSILVVGMEGWPLLPDGTISGKLRQAEEINRKLHCIQILSESIFLELVGLQVRKSELRKTYSSAEVCRVLGIEPATLQRWEQFSLVHSTEGMYDFQDILTLRMIANLLQQGVRRETIATSIQGLASILPGTEKPLAQLQIIAENHRSILAYLGDIRMTPTGQLVFNFDPATRVNTRVLGLPSGKQTAREWFERGKTLEEEEDLGGAEKAYLKALSLQPQFPEAYFNLGNVLQEQGRLGVATKALQTCLAQDPEFVAAWSTLADIQAILERHEEAIESLKQAIRVSPSFADAHFNLASCLERKGRHREASRHWAEYMKLDPDSPWAEVARCQLSAQGK